ncbi:MAG TPA: hypothetical protein VLM85_05385, partial [Polyangiaceae bacterium]|nr:hypothetical protein [Polyangiaceae bacterium]
GEAHLTVDVVRYEMRRRKRAGVASSMLADRAPPGLELDVYVQPAPEFRLPAADVPIVMIGPGTGVAPFRAFLEERAATGAAGKSWLFFGARNACDFYYEAELREFAARGVLTSLDCAFSRDQPERIYVQHRMREKQSELYRWLAEGAVVFVCGNAQRMAPDVQAALIDILAAGSGRDGVEELRKLESAGRYRKDVY